MGFPWLKDPLPAPGDDILADPPDLREDLPEPPAELDIDITYSLSYGCIS